MYKAFVQKQLFLNGKKHTKLHQLVISPTGKVSVLKRNFEMNTRV